MYDEGVQFRAIVECIGYVEVHCAADLDSAELGASAKGLVGDDEVRRLQDDLGQRGHVLEAAIDPVAGNCRRNGQLGDPGAGESGCSDAGHVLEVDRLESRAAAEHALGDGRHVVGQRHRAELGATLEHAVRRHRALRKHEALQSCAAAEHAGFERLNASEIDALERGAVVEHAAGTGLEQIGESDARQGGASGESALVDEVDVLGYVHGRQRAASVERALSQVGDAFREPDGRQRAALLEGVVA